jgi:CheY-like chemotaxis protein
MSLKILVVDDDDIILFITKTNLIKSGFCSDPLTFINAKFALDHLLANHREEDRYLIFLDINMPLMSGWNFLDEVNKTPLSKAITVIMVTSSIDSRDKQKAKEYEQVVSYIEKPLNIETCRSLKSFEPIAHLLTK